MGDLLDLADKAARCVLRGRPCWTPEDWQDATQEAAAAIWRMSKEQPDAGEGLLFTAARHAIYDWLRVWLRYQRNGTLFAWLQAYPVADEAAGSRIDAERIRGLAPLLEQQRAAKAEEDIRYLELRLAGFSTEGIAREMGVSSRNVYAIRERLLPRLERIARGETVSLHRGEAIRAGKARAKERARRAG